MGDQTLTYQQLAQKSNRLCATLKRNGVRPGDCVPVIAERTPEFIIAILAVLKSGAVYVPVDSKYPKKRINLIIEKSRSDIIVVTSEKLVELFAGNTQKIIYSATVTLNQETPTSIAEIPGDSPAYVIFTSGTTGIPKGVMVSHHSLLNLIAWHNRQYSMTEQSRSTLVAGIGFDVAQWKSGQF